uniref:IS3 family transposase n=1 Tax=Mucilaginibacter sp. TaxID=1882438 RepID=UPI00374DBF4E
VESQENLDIMRLLDEQYYATPFYGVRRLKVWLQRQGITVNRKRLLRLMNQMGWQTLFRRKSTSDPDKQNKVYPYLLKGLQIERANQVWATDITYVPMHKGFMYLCAVIDLHTRFVLNWSVSNTMTADWCRQVVDEAIQQHGCPEIFNTDQGSQFTSETFTKLLLDKEVRISMDSKGRAIDNIFIERLWRTVKYEYIYLHVADNGLKLYQGLCGYFEFYNNDRPHQSLNYQTPAVCYQKQKAA